MKTFSDFMDAIVPVLDTLKADLNRTEIGDPYNLEQSAGMSMNRGLGLQITSGTGVRNASFKQTHTDQGFAVILSESTPVHGKASAIRDTVSKLHTDATAVVKAVQQPAVWGPGIVFEGYDPIDSLIDDNAYYTLNINFSVKLIDDI